MCTVSKGVSCERAKERRTPLRNISSQILIPRSLLSPFVMWYNTPISDLDVPEKQLQNNYQDQRFQPSQCIHCQECFWQSYRQFLWGLLFAPWSWAGSEKHNERAHFSCLLKRKENAFGQYSTGSLFNQVWRTANFHSKGILYLVFF